MADKRMFSRKLISSDAFLDMPLQAQALFFHLAMRADDDGFVDSPKKIVREIGAATKHLNILKEKRYVLSFPSGIILIKHWKMHNTIPKDRYTPTVYTEEMGTIRLKDNKAYTERNRDVNSFDTDCKHDVTIDKNREEKVREEKSNITHITDADSLFERLWKIYPIKRGKENVTDAHKQKLLEIGEPAIIKAIERYKAELERDDWRQKQYGGTFFTKGFVDYLDENYEPSSEPSKKKNGFNNFKQRENDYAELSKQLLQKDLGRGHDE